MARHGPHQAAQKSTRTGSFEPRTSLWKFSSVRSEEHTSELQSHPDLRPFPTRRSSDLNAHHAVLLRHVLVRVDVQLADLQLALVLSGELIDERRDGAARAAPGSPEIHQDGILRAQDLALEVLVGKIGRAHV